MRNLKRALSLALAAVMVLGMMVIGAGAASTYDSFTDKDEIVNKEAVNTMVSLGVLAGKNDGSSFDPTGIVTRAEMAKIVAVSLNGGKDPVMGADAKTVFTDVPANHWAVAYIAYCVQQNIIAGRGNGTFGPEEPVTGSAAAKMFLCALGYRADLEGLTGNNWEINTNVLANQDADLYDGLAGLNASQGLSRDNTAQMLYNTVQAQEVYYDNLQGSHTDVIQSFNKGTMLANRFGVAKVEGVVMANSIVAIDDGATTVAGKVRLNNIQQNGVDYADKDGRSLNATYPVELGNEYLGRRVVLYVKGLKDLSPNASSMTIVGEPILSSKNTVAETANRLKDVAAVKTYLSGEGLSLPDNVDSSSVNGTVFFSKNDTAYGNVPTRGFAVTSAKENGTELTFIDHNGDGTVDYILKTLPQMAKVTVYNESGKKLTIAGEGSIDFTDIANEEDVAKDDIVLYHKVNETYYLSKVETVSGQVTAYNNSSEKITLDGTDYGKSTVRATVTSTDLTQFDAGMEMVGNTYTLYLDGHGNVVAWIIGEETLGNYAMVIESKRDLTTSFESASVKLLLADNTVSTYDVNLLASANKFGLTGTTAQKEAAMAGNMAGLKNTVVTYVVAENGKDVTLGDPAVVSSKTHASIAAGDTDYAATPGELVARTTGRYVFDHDSDAAKNKSVSVNDSTLFFIRNITENANDTYTVVNGLSNMPTTALAQESDGTGNGALISAVYTITATNPNVAKAVVVDGYFKGTSNYVFITDSYTGTETVNGERVYTYPCVYEDGKAGTIKINSANVVDGKVYEYTMSSGGYADVNETAPVAGKNGVLNGYVTTYAKGSNLSITMGDGSNTAVVSYTLATSPNLWNVENDPYPETMSSNMSVSIVLDGDGFVKTVFVSDTNVTKATVDSNVTGLTITYPEVFSGYKAIVEGNTPDARVTLTYVVTYDNGKEETKTLTAKADANGEITISVPDDAATLTITRSSAVNDGNNDGPSGAQDFTSNASVETINKALQEGDVTIKGSTFAPADPVTVPAGKTLTITGNLDTTTAPIDSLGTLDVKGNYVALAGDVFGTLKVGGDVTTAGAVSIQGKVEVTGNVDIDDDGAEIAKGASLSANQVDATSSDLTVAGSLTIKDVAGLKVAVGNGIMVKAGAIVKLGDLNYVGGSNALLTVVSGQVKRDGATGSPTWTVQGEVKFNKNATYENDNFGLSHADAKLTIAANTTVTFKSATIGDGTKLVGTNDTSKFAVDTALTITAGDVIYTAAASSPSGSNTAVANTTYKWADVDTDPGDTTMGWLAE